jgi:hypothetical protein
VSSHGAPVRQRGPRCAACATAYAALPPDEDYVPPAESPHSRLWYASRDAEKALQLALLREVGADPFRPPPRAAGFPHEIVSLATACYAERLPSGELDAARLAVLSDALEEDGGSDGSILDHLREPGPHVRGCWALDVILGEK